VGAGAGAGGIGNKNLALGNNAGAVVDGDFNIAIGFGAGRNITASNTISIGSGASAGNNDNAAAFGAGAVATRANQQVFGTTSNTYTMAGIASGASKAAQSGATQLVTTDGGGNLASASLASLGLASSTDVSGLQSQINHLVSRDNELAEGIATSVALAQPMLLPGQHFAMRAGWGGFDGANAVGLTAAGVLANNVLKPGYGTLVLDGGVGFGTDDSSVVTGRAGVSLGW